jgi:acetyltransferase-like isoleucine patch superfamily enzyme
MAEYMKETGSNKLKTGVVNRMPSSKRSRSSMHNTRYYVLHGIYFTLYSFVKYISIPFSNYLRYGVIRLFSSTIRTTYINDGVTIYFPWNVRIGKRSSLNQGVLIDGFGKVTIGEGVRIAAYTCINTADHEFSDTNIFIAEQGFEVAEVIIEDDVWIGAGSLINKGVRIGRGSIIGSGSVVTTNIPPYSIAVGAPCRPIKSRK